MSLVVSHHPPLARLTRNVNSYGGKSLLPGPAKAPWWMSQARATDQLGDYIEDVNRLGWVVKNKLGSTIDAVETFTQNGARRMFPEQVCKQDCVATKYLDLVLRDLDLLKQQQRDIERIISQIMDSLHTKVGLLRIHYATAGYDAKF